MFRKTPSKNRETTIFQELKNELYPHLAGVNGHLKGLMDRYANIIFCGMLLLIVTSFILTFFVLKPDSENQAENFKKELKAIPGELSNEFSALQDLTQRAAKMAELKAEIERIIAQDSISRRIPPIWKKQLSNCNTLITTPMKIDFKQPKYILPIIMLPFLCLLFYGYKSFSKDGPDKPIQGLSGIQSEIGKVSEHIQKKPLDSKLDASRETYKRANDGYTAIKGLELEVEESSQIKTLYNEEEKRLLDSIDNALKSAGLYSGKPDVANGFPSVLPKPSRQQSFSKEDEELLNAINQLEGKKTQVPASRYEDPMDLFKAQMAVIDSISKANDPAYQELQQKEKENHTVTNETENAVYRVQKSEGAATLFNTVTSEKKGKFIEAIIDQDIKSGTLGARLRIRLLDDILIGNAIVGRGTYLYALISGYEAQRVKLTISSVMINDRIFPIKLSIYDVDGMEGLYVPASAFREFSKELGGNTTGGMNLTMQPNSDELSQLYMSALQRMFTSTSQAVSKSIKKNKTNIKYGTSVYLIDTNELQENGKMIQNQN